MSLRVDIRSLAGVPDDVIFEAFGKAFADYGISTDPAALEAMLRRRGWSKEISYAAFDGETVAGFVLNGRGLYRNMLTAYDTGTGILPQYRGHGLTRSILDEAFVHLKAKGFGRYLLEVLQDNLPAVKVYRSMGFEPVREFDCFGAERADVAGVLGGCTSEGIEIRKVGSEFLPQCAGWFDFEPSWQNSLMSLEAAGNDLIRSGAFAAGEPVGCAVADPTSGDISLIAVSPQWRRRGIASLLMKTLIHEISAERLKVLNIEPAATQLIEFLKSLGFELTVKQWEMARNL